ncbi:MAG: zinc ribbon domain-containing protein [Desulfobacteraceae bacterium]
MNVQTFCQSCSMPICDEKMKGTKADGSVSDDYCTYCYQKGSFT